MKIGQALLLFYSLSISVLITLGAVAYSISSGHLTFFLLFLPIIAHFFLPILKIKVGYKLFLYYSFIVVTVLAIMGFVTASKISQIISAILFYPLAFYFWSLAFPKRSQPLIVSQQASPELQDNEPLKSPPDESLDQNRRMFIKLVGTAGLGILVYSLFSKKASFPFFSSASSPVDSTNKSATDGYKITEIDDSYPTYFGFVKKPDEWFIMQIGDTGAIRYTRGSKDFSSNWKNRDNLKYDYYDAVF